MRGVRVHRGSEPRQSGTQLCVSDWARPSERHLRRAGHQQQLGWFGSSKISPTSGSAQGTQADGTVMPLATHQAMSWRLVPTEPDGWSQSPQLGS